MDGKYSRQHHIASFSGFFPSYAPELVITVIVDDPELKGIGYGGLVAAPAFRNIAEACITYLGIRPVRPDPSFFALQYSMYNRSQIVSNSQPIP